MEEHLGKVSRVFISHTNRNLAIKVRCSISLINLGSVEIGFNERKMNLTLGQAQEITDSLYEAIGVSVFGDVRLGIPSRREGFMLRIYRKGAARWRYRAKGLACMSIGCDEIEAEIFIKSNDGEGVVIKFGGELISLVTVDALWVMHSLQNIIKAQRRLA